MIKIGKNLPLCENLSLIYHGEYLLALDITTSQEVKVFFRKTEAQFFSKTLEIYGTLLFKIMTLSLLSMVLKTHGPKFSLKI